MSERAKTWPASRFGAARLLLAEVSNAPLDENKSPGMQVSGPNQVWVADITYIILSDWGSNSTQLIPTHRSTSAGVPAAQELEAQGKTLLRRWINQLMNIRYCSRCGRECVTHAPKFFDSSRNYLTK